MEQAEVIEQAEVMEQAEAPSSSEDTVPLGQRWVLGAWGAMEAFCRVDGTLVSFVCEVKHASHWQVVPIHTLLGGREAFGT